MPLQFHLNLSIAIFVECPLYAKLYARSFQELFHLLFRAASELGITNPDEEIEAKGGEVEQMRKNMYKNFPHLEHK